MKTVADSRVLQGLRERLSVVQADSERRWGSLTPHEMLCHLGDATDMVLGRRPRQGEAPLRHRPLVKGLAIWTPLRWPRGRKTNPALDPRSEGTRPSEFAKDLARALEGLEGIATAAAGALVSAHGLFGTMSVRDWQRWAYKHTDHHLRQFGL